MNPSPHLNPAALASAIARLADADDVTKSSIARDAGMTPANLREYETGVRTGSSDAVRERLAEAVGLPAAAITCWCDRPDGRCRNVGES